MESSKNRLTIGGILVSTVLVFAMFTVLEEAIGIHGPTVLVVDADGFASLDQSSQPDCNGTTSAAADPNDAIYSSIQDAVNAPGPHFIIVCPGTYGSLSIGDTERIYGLSGAIIDGGGVAASAVSISGVNTVCGSPDRTVIDGFEITGATGNGITVADSCRVFIQDNDIHDNDVRGILFGRGDHSWIDNNEIHDNPEGIELGENSNDNFIGHNRIHDNTGFGIEINENFTPPTSIRNLISQNTFTDNGEWAICLCGGSGATSNKVVGNKATGNGAAGGAFAGGGAYLVIGTSNTLRSNTAKSNTGTAFKLEVFGPVTSMFNTLTKNRAISTTGDGFVVLGDTNTFTKNLARINTLDGFEATVASSGNTFKENTADTNGGEGFRDDGTANVFMGNICIADGSTPDGLGAGCT